MVPIAAVRRLLRSLDDPGALRENPLASRYFAEAERVAGSRALVERTIAARIRAAVVASVEALGMPHAGTRGERGRAIVSRCDLRGEKHDVVARALGISRREFYRERKRAFERLASALEREFASPIEPARIRPSEFDLRLRYASSLHLVGRFDAAIAEIETAIEAEVFAGERVRALCYGVEVASDAGDLSRAQRFFDAARVSPTIGNAEPHDSVSPARLAHGEGILAWLAGRIPEALRAYEGAVDMLRPPAAANDQAALDLLARVLLRMADVFSESGEPDRALALLGEARLAIDRMTLQTPILRGDLAAALGSAHAVMTGGLTLAIDELQEAFTIYQRHHAIRSAARTSIELCVLFMQREQIEESLHYGRSALGVAGSVCGKDEFAYMCLNLSYAEARGGNATRALALTRRARELVTAGSFVAALCTLAGAEARLAANHLGAAIRAARSARRVMERLGAERYVGAALRIKAEAHERLGEIEEAAGAIRAAIEILTAHGHPFSLVQAYRCSARVTHSREHALAAADLLATLQR